MSDDGAKAPTSSASVVSGVQEIGMLWIQDENGVAQKVRVLQSTPSKSAGWPRSSGGGGGAAARTVVLTAASPQQRSAQLRPSALDSSRPTIVRRQRLPCGPAPAAAPPSRTIVAGQRVAQPIGPAQQPATAAAAAQLSSSSQQLSTLSRQTSTSSHQASASSHQLTTGTSEQRESTSSHRQTASPQRLYFQSQELSISPQKQSVSSRRQNVYVTDDSAAAAAPGVSGGRQSVPPLRQTPLLRRGPALSTQVAPPPSGAAGAAARAPRPAQVALHSPLPAQPTLTVQLHAQPAQAAAARETAHVQDSAASSCGLDSLRRSATRDDGPESGRDGLLPGTAERGAAPLPGAAIRTKTEPTETENSTYSSPPVAAPTLLERALHSAAGSPRTPSHQRRRGAEFESPQTPEFGGAGGGGGGPGSGRGDSSRSRPCDKTSRGLRHFSLRVCRKVREKGVTTYNEVADELVEELCPAGAGSAGSPEQQHFEQKNVRRRVYDALNVLMAMEIISRQRKQIVWLGLPGGAAPPPPPPPEEDPAVTAERAARRRRIHQKTQQLNDLLLRQVAFKNLVDRNRAMEQQLGAPEAGSAVSLPFIVVTTNKKTVIDVSISQDKMEYLFNFDDTFEIHDDVEILRRMGMTLGLDDGSCTRQDVEKARSLVTPEAAALIDELAAEAAGRRGSQTAADEAPTPAEPLLSHPADLHWLGDAL